MSRGTFRRATGAVLLALVVFQPIAAARQKCTSSGAQAESESAAMADIGHIQRADVVVGAERPSNAFEVPDATPPDHPADCDQTLPANDCGIGVGCVSGSVIASAMTVVPDAPVGAGADFVSSTDGALRVEFAPDTPPPRV